MANIRMLQSFKGYGEGSLQDFGSAENARLVSLGYASNNLNGAARDSGSYSRSFFSVRRLLASLSASSTATRVGSVVTVSASAHGVPSGTFAGCDFFFPGCASLAAGWYQSFNYVSANSVNFSLPDGFPGADFAGESVNAGSPYTTQTRFGACVIKANFMAAGMIIGSKCFINSGSSAAGKKFVLVVDSIQFGRIYGTTAASGLQTMSASFDGDFLHGIALGVDGSLATSAASVQKNTTLEWEVALEGQILAAGDYMVVAPVFLELIK